ncbi:hypothetical protein [Streptomyces sp. NPDC005181]|uniref:hypothetical protein n=1 Tax=Streptomyces sp. NPDC005181 TaxID=3156869 RepID=UPI0033B34C2E
MDTTGEPELAVYHRHLTQLLKGDDRENFQALMVQARHITTRSYETSLYDHQQTFRLLWHHLEHTGHLRRAHHDARDRLATGQVTGEEAEKLELFLTLYARIRAGTTG